MRVRVLLSLLTGWAACAALPAAPTASLHEHRVVRGDTLIGLRDRLLDPGIRWQQLQGFNRGVDPLRLRPGSLLRFPEGWLRERPVLADLLQLHGQVWLERGEQRFLLTQTMRLQEGDRLVSEAQSSATLRFADGTRSLLRPNSRIELLQLRQQQQSARSRLRLQQGALDTEVPKAARVLSAPRFELQTPVATLGVRGTRWRAHVQDQSEGLGLEVLQGEVLASQAGAKPLAVSGGEGWTPLRGRTPLLPAPELDALGAAPFERLPVLLRWPTLPGAQGWRVQWFDAQGEQLLLEALTREPQFSGAAELPDGDYRLRVRARAQGGLEGRDAEVAVRMAARPQPPLLESPAPAARSEVAAQRFAWTRPSDAQRFRFQVASDADFSQLRVDEGDSAEVSRQLQLPPGTHHWRVATIDAQGRQGPWSEAQQFIRLALPLPPAPGPATQAAQDALLLRWPGSPVPGVRWQVQVTADTDFSAPWLDRIVDQPSTRLEGIPAGSQRMRVRMLNADGQSGPWGTVQHLESPPQRAWWLLLPLIFFIL